MFIARALPEAASQGIELPAASWAQQLTSRALWELLNSRPLRPRRRATSGPSQPSQPSQSRHR
eukprot:4571994-Pyramimonas_sp.AAC.1